MERVCRRTMEGDKVVPSRNNKNQSRRGGGNQPSGDPNLINCCVSRAARGARMRYQYMRSVEEKEIMGRVQEVVLRKRKSTTDEEIIRSTKEWVSNLGQSRTSDTKFFHPAEVY